MSILSRFWGFPADKSMRLANCASLEGFRTLIFLRGAFMKAVRIHQFGGPEVLTYEEVADPKPRKDQVLIRVRGCALNHLDLWVRKGLPGVQLPHILGSD